MLLCCLARCVALSFDSHTAAALNLDEGARSTAAQNLGNDTHEAVTCNPSEAINAAAAKEKAKRKRSYVEVAKQQKWKDQGRRR